MGTIVYILSWGFVFGNGLAPVAANYGRSDSCGHFTRYLRYSWKREATEKTMSEKTTSERRNGTSGTASAKDNAELAARVKEALMEKTRSTGVDVNVRAVNGEVTLTGIVDVASEKQAAVDIARAVPGVRAVVDNLTIATDGWIPDDDIEKELTHTLVDEGLKGVGVEVNRGNVTLLGRVEDVADEQLAIRRAAEVRGVKSVFSELSVGEPGGEDHIVVGGKSVDVGKIDVPETGD